MVDATLVEAARAAVLRRTGAVERLGEDAPAVAALCAAVAARLHRGGKLLTFGTGGPATDAQHVSVEFVHPVIVGKRALPALSLAADTATLLAVARQWGPDEVFAHQVRSLAAEDDVAIGVSPDGDDASVLRGLEVAAERGLLTVALAGGDGGALVGHPAVEHLLVARDDDPHVVKEVHVSAYHLLWEHVHVELDALVDPARPTPDAGTAGAAELAALYPFLGGASTRTTALSDEVAASARAKVEEVLRLRRQVADELAEPLAACAHALASAHRDGGRLLTFGNGGSSTDAQEVARSFLAPAPGEVPFPAVCLTNDVAVITALSNDVGFEVVFSRQVRALGRAGDVALGLSTSGNSPNLLAAFEQARSLGMVTVGLAGGDGGAMAASDAIDHLLVVPSSSVHRIQEVQTTLYHVLQELVQRQLTGVR